MRNRSLSNEGIHLFLNGMTPTIPFKKIFCQLFHTVYDDKLRSVVEKCRESTKSLCDHFDDPTLVHRLDASILHTIRLILTRDDKEMKLKYAGRNYRFFLDVMKHAFDENDHQTASMLAIALNDPAITSVPFKRPKKADPWIRSVLDAHGWENCNKHVDFLADQQNVEVLPSLMTLLIYVQRNQQLGQKEKAEKVRALMELYKNLGTMFDVLPIYNQERISRQELHVLSRKLKKK